jgi:hypothetical protein
MAAGVQSLSKSAMDGLKANLAGQSAPPNPATPTNRQEDSDATLIDLQRIRRALDVAQEHMTKNGDPASGADPRELLIGGMHACVSRLLSRIELSDAVDVLLERLFPLSSPELKQKLQAMYKPISPPTGLGGGAPGAGSPAPGPGGAGAATGQPPGAAPAVMPGDAGPPA